MSKQWELGGRTRLALVVAGSLAMFGLGHANIDINIPSIIKHKTVVRSDPVDSPLPPGELARSECGRLEGMTFAQVVHRYGLPRDMSMDATFFDALHYPIRGAEQGEACHVYFEASDDIDSYEDPIPSKYIVRNVSLDL